MAKSKKVRRGRPKQTRSTTTAEQRVIEKPAAENTTDQFQQEYAYVVKDLRRVFLLAAAMFILLIALNLILR